MTDWVEFELKDYPAFEASLPAWFVKLWKSNRDFNVALRVHRCSTEQFMWLCNLEWENGFELGMQMNFNSVGHEIYFPVIWFEDDEKAAIFKLTYG